VVKDFLIPLRGELETKVQKEFPCQQRRSHRQSGVRSASSSSNSSSNSQHSHHNHREHSTQPDHPYREAKRQALKQEVPWKTAQIKSFLEAPSFTKDVVLCNDIAVQIDKLLRVILNLATLLEADPLRNAHLKDQVVQLQKQCHHLWRKRVFRGSVTEHFQEVDAALEIFTSKVGSKKPFQDQDRPPFPSGQTGFAGGGRFRRSRGRGFQWQAPHQNRGVATPVQYQPRWASNYQGGRGPPPFIRPPAPPRG